MKLIIKLFPEITIKSQSVRLFFIKILSSNIKRILKQYDTTLIVMRYWDYIEIRAKNKNQQSLITDALTRIPGIHQILLVEDRIYTDIHDIFKQILTIYHEILVGQTFCVRVKRRGNQNFTSQDLERYIGNKLNQHVKNARVNLSCPQVTVNLEIKDNRIRLIKSRSQGIGGYPIGTQEEALSLISGGFDSGVSSYMMMRRGCKIHFCFFNLGDIAHEISVKKLAYYLWNRFSSSHKIRFITIDFTVVVSEIVEKVNDSEMGVILKRMMIRAASLIAACYGVHSLVTGEALGQVSSQTLTNLRLIDDASDRLILRPLISYDKEHIIKIARNIGIEIFSKNMPEFCNIISRRPTVRAVKEKIEKEESKFNFAILDQVVNQSKNIDISTFTELKKEEKTKIDTIFSFSKQDIILDIRSIDEQESKLFQLNGVEVKSLPFYKIRHQFHTLDQSKTYFLYCESGLMSRLQALYLLEQGYNNVKVYCPLIS